MPDQSAPTGGTKQLSDSLGDIQGIVLYGYGHLLYSRHLLLKVSDPEKGRILLAGLLPFVIDARRIDREEDRYHCALNIAVTASGLTALGLDPGVLQLFPDEFRDGMSQPYRARQLGDNGNSDPKQWHDFGGALPDGRPDSAKQPDLLLLLFGEDGERMDALFQRVTEVLALTDGAVTVLYDQDDMKLQMEEHFGFRDGISNPVPKGLQTRSKKGEKPVAAGEFILGYPNAYETFPFSPSISGDMDTTNALPPVRPESIVGTTEIANKATAATEAVATRKDLGHNGSYLVYRKLEQDVAGFWSYCTKQSATGPDSPVLIASKMMGRWPSGASITEFPVQEDPAQGEDYKPNNDFGYAQRDGQGFNCPFGAHVRRANPRDHLTPDREESLLISSRHRIMRRGRTYGSPMNDPRSGVDDGQKRGLIFIGIVANIARQFEFVQQTWLNNPKFHDLFYDRDPISGDNSDPGTTNGIMEIPCRFTIPKVPVRRRLNEVPRVVTVRAGAYFFIPSISALCFLARVPRVERPAVGGSSSP